VRPIKLFHRRFRHCTISVLFEARDLWVGIFWDYDQGRITIYLCGMPTIVLKLTFRPWSGKP